MQGSNSATYALYLNNSQAIKGFLDVDAAANKTESNINALNSTLREFSHALGIGLGTKAIVDFGKDSVEGAADFETAIKRIKFSSDDLKEGARNIAFINEEVDRFRIPLQQATDDYGKFLAQLAGSGYSADLVRKLHDNLLMIGKIKGLDMGQLSAGVMNLGKMLEAGAMDARHLRPLEQQLSGIGKFIADEMGVSVHELAKLRNKGKLTDINPDVLLTAIEKQARSLEKFLPESLTTIQSEINDVSNAWLRFKNELVFENRAALQDLFNTMREGITFIKNHKDDIIHFGHVVIKLGEAWLAYKGVMLLVNTAMATRNAFMAGYVGQATAEITATEAKALAYNSLAAAIERVNLASSFGGAYGVGKYGTPLLAAGAGMAGRGAAAAEAGALAGGGALAGVSILNGALLVALSAGSIALLAHAMGSNVKGVRMPQGGGYLDSQPNYGHMVDDTLGYTITKKYKDLHDAIGVADTLYNTTKRFVLDTADVSSFSRMDDRQQKKILSELMKSADKEGKGGKHGKEHEGGKFLPPNDKIQGNRIIQINNYNKDISGIKNLTIEKGGNISEEDISLRLRDVIMATFADPSVYNKY